jgi:anti-sigma factor RsiW
MDTTGTMSCAEARAHIDGFVDGELSPAVSIDVARHLGQCERCDGTVQGLLAMREALVREADRTVASLDLSGVWAQVDRTITHAAAQDEWRARLETRRRVPRAVAWGTIAAIAAAAALFLRPTADTKPMQIVKGGAPATVARAAGKRLPNHVYIDRLAGKDIALRREPKSGTTMIWVNHEVESSGW